MKDKYHKTITYIVYKSQKKSNIFAVSAQGFRKNKMELDNIIILDCINAISKSDAILKYKKPINEKIQEYS